MVRQIWIAGVVALALSMSSGLVCGQEDFSQPAPPAKGRTFLSDLRNGLFGSAPKEEPRKPAAVEPKRTPAPAMRSAPVAQRAPTPGTMGLETAGSVVTAPSASSLVAKKTMASSEPVLLEADMNMADDIAGPATGATTSNGPTSRPLHERMTAFRKSSFGDDEERADIASMAAPSDEPIEPTARGEVRSPVNDGPRIPAAPSSRDPYTKARNTATQRPKQTVPAVTASPRPSPVRREASVTGPAIVSSVAPGAPHPKTGANDNQLVARKCPILSVETLGPRRITVGKESSYQLTVSNTGEVAANEVVVFVSLPAWAEVIGSESIVGATQPGIAGDEKKPLQWKVGQVAAGAKERLTLRIVPRESRPFDLGVRWDYRPVASQAMIEVQEPKLAMHLEGPREVNYGKREIFTLRLSNAGTGDAENVAIALMPIGTGENQPATHRIGVIGAGEEKAIEIELTARQTGNLTVQVEARADGDIHAELAEKVLVRRAAVNVEIAGPSVQFVNSVANYRVRVTNPGNAVARNVRLTAILPPGSKYVSGIESARVDGGGAKIHWTVDTIHSQAEEVYAIKCSVGAAGQNRLEVVASADDEINATASTVTRVEAIADVAMEVRDPSGPVAVGEEANYELRVHNRGTKAAEGVEVMAFFSNGVEPIAVDGGQHRIQPGQVTFSPIASIAPGAEVVFKIRAKAQVAGAHVFRAEAHCKTLGTRLVREETTHFYLDTPAGSPATQMAEDTVKALPPMQDSRENVESASKTNLPRYAPMKR